ncbi:MAG: hypothetical protein M1327_04230 [Candidatus Thermoplasmatota archaeon]|nr:hypothetical protein [Candidatus Thermoplasmatota archaeon]
MPDEEPRKQQENEIYSYLGISAGSPPSLGGPVKPEELAREIMDAVSKRARNLVEVVDAYSIDGYKSTLLQIYNILSGNNIHVGLLSSIDSYITMKPSGEIAVYMLSEDHMDLKSPGTLSILRKIMSGDVDILGKKGILVLGITQQTIDMVTNTGRKSASARNTSDEYSFPHSKAAGSGFIVFSLPLAVTAFGLFDSTGYNLEYSPYVMGFWVFTSFVAVLLLIIGFRRTTAGGEKRSILSCAVFIALNLVILATIGPSVLEILVSNYPLYHFYLVYLQNAVISKFGNVALEVPPILFSVTIIYWLLPENLRKFSLIAFFCGLASIIIETVALVVYPIMPTVPPNISNVAIPVPQVYLSYFSYVVFIHPSLALGATIYTQNYFKIYVSIPVIGFAFIYNIFNFYLYARMGIGMLSRQDDLP